MEFDCIVFKLEYKLMYNPQSITPVGPLPDILPKDEEVPAVAAALRSMKQ